MSTANGVTFGQYHSWRDFNLILKPKELGSPAVKVQKIEIDGADSDIDYTEFFGEPKYENVTHTFDFSTIVPHTEFVPLFSLIKNALHGKKVRIILDDDPAFYYFGRCSVSNFVTKKGYGEVSIECDCEPYKYRINNTVVTVTVTDSETVILKNSRKRAVPKITVSTESSISIENQSGNTWFLDSGTYTLPELELVEGNNLLTLTGAGTVSFEWQEGEL